MPLTLVDPPPTRSRDPYWVYLDNLQSDESRRAMRRCLDSITMIVLGQEASEPIHGDHITGASRAWWDLRYEHTAAVRAAMLDLHWSPSSFNQHLSALRQILKECWRLQLMTADDYQRAIDIDGLKGHREPAGRTIHADEREALLRICLKPDDQTGGPTLIGIRDAAVLAFLYSTGCRREETASAVIECYNPGERALQVIGKGNKQRTVYISTAAAPHFDRWLVVLGDRRGAIFRPIDRWGHIGTDRLNARSIGRIVNERRQQAGLPPLSTHDFRRTFVGDVLDAGLDLVHAQRAVGHDSPATTALYDHRGGRAIRDVVDTLHLPSPAEIGGTQSP